MGIGPRAPLQNASAYKPRRPYLPAPPESRTRAFLGQTERELTQVFPCASDRVVPGEEWQHRHVASFRDVRPTRNKFFRCRAKPASPPRPVWAERQARCVGKYRSPTHLVMKQHAGVAAGSWAS